MSRMATEGAATTSRAGRSQRLRYMALGIGLVLMGLCVLLALISPYFLTQQNLTNVLLQSSINTIVAVGMTFVILTAGIDLGVGSVVALSGVVLGGAMKADVPIPGALAVGLGVGALTGFINGVLITKGGVPPFIATLGMMSVARGLALVYTKGQSLYVFPATFLEFFGTGSLGPVPMPALIAAATVAAAYFLLGHTRFGRYAFAIGGNLEAARLSGIRVDAVLIGVYVLAGVTYALGGAVLVGRLNSAQPIAGMGYELDAIAAAVIGGTSLSGGRGSVGGTVIGALIMGVVRNGLNLMNVSSYVQQVVIGSVIVLAVLVDRVQKAHRD
ncbi:sugar ABC transporter permease [Limnochorda pilosa]|uniref:Sugar ABC transporter permease n=2 Tax=Limnochorda pilosa TaxID=1555112 RepID=A0A0K2SMM7_LIMPI|nr:ribose ABC transporter permease [Limnochorda pilosa]BAS28079.1 sugar ABC transporter permease [Limnochorda pilosa]